MARSADFSPVPPFRGHSYCDILAAAYIAERSGLLALAERLTRDRQVAEDIVQDVVLQLLTGSHGLPFNLRAYLRRSVWNRAKNELRRRRAWSQCCVHTALHPARVETPDRVFERAETISAISRLFDVFPARCREVAHGHWIEGRSCAELAREFGISVKAIEKQLARARRIARSQPNALVVGATGL